MNKNIFDFDDYRAYLLQAIAERDGKGRGFRSQLAERIGCQRTFVTQVLRGDAHFNLEHGEAISEALGHTEDEADFFLTLILYGRAGTHRLRERFKRKMEEVRREREILKNRFREEDVISLEDKVQYYSSWLYGALRVLLTIPEYQSRAKVHEYFKLPKEQISQALEFLASRGLISETDDGRLETTQKHFYLGNDSHLIAKHHTNWRMRAIQSLDCERKTELHFSAVNSLSYEDVVKIREALIQAIESARNTVKESNPEQLYALCVDFFQA